MKKIVPVVVCVLLAVLIVSCGKPQEQAGAPPTATVEPQKGEVEQVSQQVPQEEEQPAPAPQPPPKQAPVPTATPKTPVVQKTATSTGQTSNTTAKTISTMRIRGIVIELTSVKLDKGIVQTPLGRKYKFVNTANLKLGDMVEFQLENYYAINIKRIASENRQMNTTR